MSKETLIPLVKAVAAAIVDTYEDKGKVEQMFFHWAAREFKELNRNYIKGARRYATLFVNKNTYTATLPSDFKKELFLGVIINGEKVPLPLNYKLADSSNIPEVECEDKCNRCGQSNSICEDLEVSEEINVIVINGTPYEQNVIKKLYPNGDYYLETVDPIFNTVTEEIDYIPSKKFITNFDLKPCGCLDNTEENMLSLQTHCPDVYGCYFASSCNSCEEHLGGYKVFEETGLIQFDLGFKRSKVYLEYEGFLPKVNGQLQVPEVAFEAVVEGTKYRSIKNRNGQPMWRIQMYEESAKKARRVMKRVMGRTSLRFIVESAFRLPKFDITRPKWRSCFVASPVLSASTTTENIEDPSPSGSVVTEIIRDRLVYGKLRFIVGVDSPMVDGDTQIVIASDGTTEKKVMSKSVNVMLDGLDIEEIDFGAAFDADRVQFKVQYTDAETKVYFNQEARDDQRYKITYVKTV